MSEQETEQAPEEYVQVYFEGVGDCSFYDSDATLEDWQDYWVTAFDKSDWDGLVHYFVTESIQFDFLYEFQDFRCLVARNPELEGPFVCMV